MFSSFFPRARQRLLSRNARLYQMFLRLFAWRESLWLRPNLIMDKHSAFGEFLGNAVNVSYSYIFHWGYLPMIFLRAYSETETSTFSAAAQRALYSSRVSRKRRTVPRLSDAAIFGR